MDIRRKLRVCQARLNRVLPEEIAEGKEIAGVFTNFSSVSNGEHDGVRVCPVTSWKKRALS